MGSAEVAGTPGQLGAAGSVCPLFLYGDLVFLWRSFIVAVCLLGGSVVFLAYTRPTYTTSSFFAKRPGAAGDQHYE